MADPPCTSTRPRTLRHPSHPRTIERASLSSAWHQGATLSRLNRPTKSHFQIVVAFDVDSERITSTVAFDFDASPCAWVFVPLTNAAKSAQLNSKRSHDALNDAGNTRTRLPRDSLSRRAATALSATKPTTTVDECVMAIRIDYILHSQIIG